MEICKCAFDVLAYLAIIQSFDLKNVGHRFITFMGTSVHLYYMHTQAEVRLTRVIH